MSLLNGNGAGKTKDFVRGHYIGLSSIVALIAFGVPLFMRVGANERQLQDIQAVVDSRAAMGRELADLKRAVDDHTLEILSAETRMDGEHEYDRSVSSLSEARDRELRRTIAMVQHDALEASRDVAKRTDAIAARLFDCTGLRRRPGVP